MAVFDNLTLALLSQLPPEPEYDPRWYRNELNKASLRDAMYLPDGGPTYQPERDDVFSRIIDYLSPSYEAPAQGYPVGESTDRTAFRVRVPGEYFDSSVPKDQFTPEQQRGMKDYISEVRGNERMRNLGIPDVPPAPTLENGYAVPVDYGYDGLTAVMYPTGDKQYSNGVIESPYGTFNYDPNMGDSFEAWIRGDAGNRIDAARRVQEEGLRRGDANLIRTGEDMLKYENARLTNALEQHRRNMKQVNSVGSN